MSEIFEQVGDILKYCEHVSPTIEIDTSDLESWWAYHKKFWIELMPDYIAELPEPITIHLTDHDKKQLYSKFLNNDLLEDYEYLWNFLSNISAKQFFNKYLEKDYEAYLDEYDEWLKIQKGTRITKAFKFFHLQEEDLKELQSEASRILQLDCVTGRLCLSVHPLDYLSASENISNWRSCHSLDGCYRAGNLSYMTDNSTIIVYLRSETQVQLPNFPEGLLWNNKKWRMFLHFDADKNIVFTTQQYPFNLEDIFDYITKLINMVIRPTEYCFTKFDDDFIIQTKKHKELAQRLIPLGGCAKRIGSIVKQDDWNLAYTDLIFKDTLHFKWAYKSMRFDVFDCQEDETGGFQDEFIKMNYNYSGYTNEFTKLRLGNRVVCPFCNAEPLTDGETMMCKSCEESLFSPHELEERRKERM